MTEAPGPAGTVALTGLVKRYGATVALDGISLRVVPGEFFTLLGPSGCGKTTTLRSVAGFVTPDAGRVAINGADVTDVPPHLRRVGMVFQHYALFPHRTVAQNVAFGLRMQRVPRTEIAQRVADALSLVQLPAHGARYPRQLSGGEQQRVALARALVTRPSVLLLDEPLGALDKKLRDHMKIELKRLQREVGITTIYVTHDQEEALTMSDRLAVMAGGRVEQLGAPRDVYEHPESAFVADFLGVSNLMRGRIVDGRHVDVGGVTLSAAQGEARPGVVRLTIRPERVRIEPPATPGENRVQATIERFVYLGSTTQVFVALPGGDRVQALVANSGDVDEYDVGAAVTAHLPADALRILADDEPVTA